MGKTGNIEFAEIKVVALEKEMTRAIKTLEGLCLEVVK